MDVINIHKILSILVFLFNLKYSSSTSESESSIDTCNSSAAKSTNDTESYCFFSARVEITATRSNSQYEYSLRNNIHVFTAKDGYKFNLLTENDRTIWHTMDYDNYSDIILFDNSKNHIRIKINGGDKDYIKERNTWQLISPPLTSPLHPEDPEDPQN